MKFRDNIILLYTVFTLFVIFSASVTLSFFLTRWISEQQILKHTDLYPEIVSEEIRNYPDLIADMARADIHSTPQSVQGFVTDLKSLGAVFRVKIWGPGALILWSDEKGIIGKRFPDNDEYAKAWSSGTITYEVSKPEKAEHTFENSHRQILEIYIPVKRNGKIVLVVEVYEATDVLFDDIKKSSVFIWESALLSGAVIYLLLFLIFYRAHQRQKQMTEDLLKADDITIMCLAGVAETRDNETGAHILRTQKYIEVLANRLKDEDPYRQYLTPETIELLVKSSPLHDIGKVGVPDAILLKPGKLTSEEFEHMKKHTVYGRDSLKKASEVLGTNSFLETAMEIVYSHHEKWDGSGYPEGKSGFEIPVSARLMAVADVYDALISKRVYKEAFSHEKAVKIIQEGSGGHFDPQIVDIFLRSAEIFRNIAEQFRDEV